MRLVSTVDTYRYNRSQESELANYNLAVISALMVYRGANLSGFIRSGKIRGKHIFFEMVRENQGKSGNSTKKSGKTWKKSGRFFWKVLTSFESRSIVYFSNCILVKQS